MTNWQAVYRARPHYTITEAAYLLRGLNPGTDKLKPSELSAAKREIIKAIEDELISIHYFNNGYGNPDREARITRDSFKKWRQLHGDNGNFLLNENVPANISGSPTDDMPETLKIVLDLWPEIRQKPDRETITSIADLIKERYPQSHLTTELRKSCARVLIGSSQGGRPRKTNS